MIKPNLFSFATSELSQDAFFSWLIAWGSPEYEHINSELHLVATKFLSLLFKKNDMDLPEMIQCIRVNRQVNNIDILVIIQLSNEDEFYIIIEDKVKANVTGNQLSKYMNYALAKQPELGRIIPIYIQSRPMDVNQSSKIEYIEKSGFKVLDYNSLVGFFEMIKELKIKNDILSDFIINLETINFKKIKLNDWSTENWITFFDFLSKELEGYFINFRSQEIRFEWNWKGNYFLRIDKYLRVYIMVYFSNKEVYDEKINGIVSILNSLENEQFQFKKSVRNSKYTQLGSLKSEIMQTAAYTDNNGYLDIDKFLNLTKMATVEFNNLIKKLP